MEWETLFHDLFKNLSPSLQNIFYKNTYAYIDSVFTEKKKSIFGNETWQVLYWDVYTDWFYNEFIAKVLAEQELKNSIFLDENLWNRKHLWFLSKLENTDQKSWNSDLLYLQAFEKASKMSYPEITQHLSNSMMEQNKDAVLFNLDIIFNNFRVDYHLDENWLLQKINHQERYEQDKKDGIQEEHTEDYRKEYEKEATKYKQKYRPIFSKLVEDMFQWKSNELTTFLQERYLDRVISDFFSNYTQSIIHNITKARLSHEYQETIIVNMSERTIYANDILQPKDVVFTVTLPDTELWYKGELTYTLTIPATEKINLEGVPVIIVEEDQSYTKKMNGLFVWYEWLPQWSIVHSKWLTDEISTYKTE